MGKLEEMMCNSSLWKLKLYHRLAETKVKLNKLIYSDEYFVKKSFKQTFGREIDLNNPRTLNEKMLWLKLYEHKEFHTLCADKFKAREYIAKEFGEEYLVPLLYQTKNFHNITPDVIPNCHCIIKTNHGCGDHLIVRDDKNKIDFPRLREKLRYQLNSNYYYKTREWQYKNIEPRIIIEKLLETKEGKIPNDYKLHFINGEFQFVYISYDREGVNDRCIYDKDWNRMPFMWIGAESYKPSMNKTDVPRPQSFDKMLEFGTKVAQNFKLVRVDFYDVDGMLYFGEITLHHGSGTDKFFPEEYDAFYGEKLKLK